MCWECIYLFYKSASIIDYCTFWIVGDWFVCIMILQMCVHFGEVVLCVHCSDASTFTTWFDDDELVILEVVQYLFLLQCQVPLGFSTRGGDGDEVLFSTCKKVN